MVDDVFRNERPHRVAREEPQTWQTRHQGEMNMIWCSRLWLKAFHANTAGRTCREYGRCPPFGLAWEKKAVRRVSEYYDCGKMQSWYLMMCHLWETGTQGNIGSRLHWIKKGTPRTSFTSLEISHQKVATTRNNSSQIHRCFDVSMFLGIAKMCLWSTWPIASSCSPWVITSRWWL